MILMRHWGILICCSFLLSPVSWAETENTFHDEQLGISIQIPVGWAQDTDRPIDSSQLVAFKRGGSEISLHSFDFESAAEEVRDFLSETGLDILGYQSYLLSKTDWLAKPTRGPEKVVVGNQEAAVSLSEGSVFGSIRMRVLEYVFYDPKRKRAHHIRLYSPDDAFEADEVDFLSAIGTFVID